MRKKLRAIKKILFSDYFLVITSIELPNKTITSQTACLPPKKALQFLQAQFNLSAQKIKEIKLEKEFEVELNHLIKSNKLSK